MPPKGLLLPLICCNCQCTGKEVLGNHRDLVNDQDLTSSNALPESKVCALPCLDVRLLMLLESRVVSVLVADVRFHCRFLPLPGSKVSLVPHLNV